MSSRSTPSIRALRQKMPLGKSVARLPQDPVDRDPPALEPYERGRKMVCRRCGLIMPDCEEMVAEGEFCHVAKPHQTRAAVCVNANRSFGISSPEVTPFMRKARRRALKRLGVRP